MLACITITRTASGTATSLMSGKLFDSKENGIVAHLEQIIQLDLDHVADDVGQQNVRIFSFTIYSTP